MDGCIILLLRWIRMSIGEYMFEGMLGMGDFADEEDRVEIIAKNPVDQTEDVKETDVETYNMNHTMYVFNHINLRELFG